MGLPEERNFENTLQILSVNYSVLIVARYSLIAYSYFVYTMMLEVKRVRRGKE